MVSGFVAAGVCACTAADEQKAKNATVDREIRNCFLTCEPSNEK
jgi:hypothetical protein